MAHMSLKAVRRGHTWVPRARYEPIWTPRIGKPWRKTESEWRDLARAASLSPARAGGGIARNAGAGGDGRDESRLRPPAVDRLGLTNNPRIKHCRASHLAACGHTVLPKIGPVIALRRRTDYQSPNWLSGAEDELSQPRFDEVTLRNYRPVGRRKGNMSLSDPLPACR